MKVPVLPEGMFMSVFQNRAGSGWLLLFDPQHGVGELRGDALGQDSVLSVRLEHGSLRLDSPLVQFQPEEKLWLRACALSVIEEIDHG